MKISLDYFLRKQRVTLLSFCKRNKIGSYDALVNYCVDKRMIPVAEIEWDSQVASNVSKPVTHKKLQEIVDSKVPKKSPVKRSTARKETKNAETNEAADTKTKTPRRRRRSSQKPKK